MGKLNVDHPDIIDFITYKAEINKKIEKAKAQLGEADLIKILDDSKELTYFNLSVGATDEFMNKVILYVEKGIDSDWELIGRKSKKPVKTVKISYLWNLIVKNAWSSGDPGILFMDTIKRANPVPTVPLDATNPCGEQPLSPYESCNLGSINLYNMLHFEFDEFGKLKNVKLDYAKLEYTIRTSVRFLDAVIEANYYPLPEIKEKTRANRKIGLGVMGVADMLYGLGLRYGSDQAVEVCEEVMNFINDIAFDESCYLGKLFGNFPNWGQSAYADLKVPMRNATRTTIAPTGTISILAGVSSGIEPLFGIAFDRTVRETHSDGDYKLRFVNPVLKMELERRGFYSESLMDKIVKNSGRLNGIEDIPDSIKEVFITAFDVTPMEHLKMQQAFQKFTDNAVSKTINMPSNASEKDISDIYITAYKMRLKGVTIYRDGSLDSQVLNTTGNALNGSKKDQGYTQVKPRPAITEGYTVKVKSGCCKMNATVGFDEGRLFDVRVQNAEGGCSAMYQGLGMMASESIRLGGDPKRVAQQLRQITCPACTNRTGLNGKSCPDILGRVIENAVEGKDAMLKFVNKEIVSKPKFVAPQEKSEKVDSSFSVCPSCGEKQYINQEGCGVCMNCGYSKCK